jgi:ribosome biogenesis GTPase A
MKRHSKAPPISNWHIIREQIKYVDLLIEVCDARAPFSSRHPKTKEIFVDKPTLLVLNKADLADKKLLLESVSQFNKSDYEKVLPLSLKVKTNKQVVLHLIKSLTEAKRTASIKKGINMPVTRICVIGMPNVGKSSLINWLCGRRRAKVGDKPGITRGPQWIKIDLGLELLDTPGILPRENMDKKTIEKLAILNLITGSPIDEESLANEILNFLCANYPMAIKEYLQVENNSIENVNLEALAQKRNFLSSGGKYNLLRAANTLISDVRCGKLGGIFLDKV